MLAILDYLDWSPCHFNCVGSLSLLQSSWTMCASPCPSLVESQFWKERPRRRISQAKWREEEWYMPWSRSVRLLYNFERWAKKISWSSTGSSARSSKKGRDILSSFNLLQSLFFLSSLFVRDCLSLINEKEKRLELQTEMRKGWNWSKDTREDKGMFFLKEFG